MRRFTWQYFTMVLLAIICSITIAAPSYSLELKETPFFKHAVETGQLPPVENRIPDEPFVVNLEEKGRAFGKHGGSLRTMITRSKDIRQMVVYGYARLVGYNEEYELVPDILKSIEVTDNRIFTLKLRKGHKWSDGHPFTSEDFKYWWVDIANNKELSPSGPPDYIKANGESPVVLFPDATTVIYSWSNPKPEFLALLAQARPPFIYRPKHYLKKFHKKYADEAFLKQQIEKKKVRSWASLHNKLDSMYKYTNEKLPTLQPWTSPGKKGGSRRVFERNPFYHRIDSNGLQLPYIDSVEMLIAGSGLIAAKCNAGEVDLQGRGLDFNDISILKKGEREGGNYRVYLWPNGTASQIAIYPNLNYADKAWQKIIRDVRFRRALSLGIDRRMINRALYFGMAKEGAMTALPISPFYDEKNFKSWAVLDLGKANALLDEIGMDKRDGDGIRLLPDGRRAQILIETAGERREVESSLQILTDSWRELGLKLVIRPLDRDILRKHVSTGQTMMATWFGWDNGIPLANTSPDYLSPRRQNFFAWPKWGQYYQTNGKAGEPVDMSEPQKLLDLASAWETAKGPKEKSVIWRKMLAIHADQVFGIGIISQTPQPIVVSNKLRNVPENALWTWDPGAHFGIQRPDEFFFIGQKGE